MQCFVDDSQQSADDTSGWTLSHDRLYRANLVRDALIKSIFNHTRGKKRHKKNNYRLALASTVLSYDTWDKVEGSRGPLQLAVRLANREYVQQELTEHQRRSSDPLEDVFAQRVAVLGHHIESSLCELAAWLCECTLDLPRPDSPTLSGSNDVSSRSSDLLKALDLASDPSTVQRVERFTLASSGNSILTWSPSVDFIVKHEIDAACVDQPPTRKKIINLLSGPLAVAGGQYLTVALMHTEV